MKKTKNIDFDKNGEIASTGQINMDIINQFIEHDIYSSEDRHSYDRNEFDFNFVKGLIFEDAVATLNYFTALIISNYLNDNYINCSNVILCGGGRKNKTLIQNLKSLLKKNIFDIDKFNYDGDFIESQAFAYLAIRTLINEPITFPDTFFFPLIIATTPVLPIPESTSSHPNSFSLVSTNFDVSIVSNISSGF